jgi:hypothetical protein
VPPIPIPTEASAVPIEATASSRHVLYGGRRCDEHAAFLPCLIPAKFSVLGGLSEQLGQSLLLMHPIFTKPTDLIAVVPEAPLAVHPLLAARSEACKLLLQFHLGVGSASMRRKMKQ